METPAHRNSDGPTSDPSLPRPRRPRPPNFGSSCICYVSGPYTAADLYVECIPADKTLKVPFQSRRCMFLNEFDYFHFDFLFPFRRPIYNRGLDKKETSVRGVGPKNPAWEMGMLRNKRLGVFLCKKLCEIKK